MANIPCISIENAKIAKRNFHGEERAFNPAGKRNFLVVFEDEELIEKLKEDGWNIKTALSKEDDSVIGFLQVSVSFDYYPPKIALIRGKNKILLDEETVGQLDYAEIENIDIIIRPYAWKGKDGRSSGIKAYVKTMYVTVHEDEFESKYDYLDENTPF